MLDKLEIYFEGQALEPFCPSVTDEEKLLNNIDARMTVAHMWFDNQVIILIC